MSDFSVAPLGDCLEVFLDYRGKSPPKAEQGVPVISAKVVKEGRIVRPVQQQIAPDYYPVWMTRGYPKAGDVVLTTEGPLGEVAQLDEETCHYALGQRIVVMRGRNNVLDNNYLRFLLMSHRQQEVLASYATGTTVEGISQKSLRLMPVPLPLYDDQVVIGSLLAALDDKIALNRRMNETLEATMRSVFKEWFVDFGPTRAKARNAEPYLPRELWRLFPEKLDDGGKPEGWSDTPLGDIAENLTRTVDPSEVSPETAYVGLEHMPRCSIALDSWGHAGKVTSGKLSFKEGEFLFGKLRPYFHKVGIAPIDGISSTDIVVCRARKGFAGPLVLSVISSPEFVRYTDQTSTGTKMPRTSWSTMRGYKVTLPPTDDLMKAFGEFASPLIKQIVTNVIESKSLIETRDFLLPKLMVGDIHIKNVGRIIEDGL